MEKLGRLLLSHPVRPIEYDGQTVLFQFSNVSWTQLLRCSGFLWGMGCGSMMAAHKLRLYSTYYEIMIISLCASNAWRIRGSSRSRGQCSSSHFCCGIKRELPHLRQRCQHKIRHDQTSFSTEELERRQIKSATTVTWLATTKVPIISSTVTKRSLPPKVE